MGGLFSGVRPCNTQWWNSNYIDLHWFWVYKRENLIWISKKNIFLPVSCIYIMNTSQFTHDMGAETVEEHHITTNLLVLILLAKMFPLPWLSNYRPSYLGLFYQSKFSKIKLMNCCSKPICHWCQIISGGWPSLSLA